ncbi:MAG: T9SS type A sorting domain-containing protein [Bacteroidales bacterium]|nr:T9SS type A sorting domain-containing protein [Bacteroidales bacterium]
MKKQTLFLALLLVLALAGRGQVVEELPNSPSDQMFCVSHPVPNIVYCGGLKGLYKSDDDGETWNKIFEYDSVVAPFKGICFFDDTLGFASAAANPKNAGAFIGTPEDNKLYRTTDGGISWALIDTSHYFTNIRFINKDTLFAIDESPYLLKNPRSDGNLYRSVDGGWSWEELDVLGNKISDYSFVPPSIVYAVKGCDHCYITPPYNYIPIVYKSTDWGTSWTTIFSAENFQSKAPIEIDQIHFFEDRDGVLMGHQQIFTEDDFTTFEIANSGYYVSNPGGPYLVIQAKYLNSGYCVATSWAWDPHDILRPSTIRLSRDKGHHYLKINLGEDVSDVSGCEQDTTFFVVYSWGPSVYRIRGANFPNVAVEDHRSQVEVLVSPNPVTDRPRILCEKPVQTIRVLDMAGRLKYQQTPPIPQTDFLLNTSSWPSGLYLLELFTTKGRTTVKIVKK